MLFPGGDDEESCGNCEKDELYCTVQGVNTCLSPHFLCDGHKYCHDGLVCCSHVSILLQMPILIQFTTLTLFLFCLVKFAIHNSTSTLGPVPISFLGTL